MHERRHRATQTIHSLQCFKESNAAREKVIERLTNNEICERRLIWCMPLRSVAVSLVFPPPLNPVIKNKSPMRRTLLEKFSHFYGRAASSTPVPNAPHLDCQQVADILFASVVPFLVATLYPHLSPRGKFMNF